ncbi:MAG: S8 family serine peptidase [Opitutae bacterium]|nr:S8 family serine peptidase [Opitutae bacterium]
MSRSGDRFYGIIAFIVLIIVVVGFFKVQKNREAATVATTNPPALHNHPDSYDDGAATMGGFYAHNNDDIPAGAVAGEKILFFKDEKSMRDFLDYARQRGVKILGVIESAGIVRVRDDANFAALGIPAGIVGEDYNFRMRIPEEIGASLDDADARENVVGGRVPVGANALSQLGFSADDLANSARGAGVKIAILDSGILLDHIALRGASISQIDVVGGAPDTAESLSHGTAVASLVCGNGEGGVVGAAANAEIVAVRIFDGNGDADSFTAAAGIYAAIEAGAQIVNISAGLSEDSAVLRQAVEFAISQGVTIVAAAGNEGLTALAYPAAYSGVIAVGAVDAENSSAPFSNVGDNLLSVAPGVGIVAAGTADTNVVTSFSGTSASAPLVAGTLAAAISDSAELGTAASAQILSSEDLADKVAAASDDLGVPGFDEEYGAGILNYSRLVRAPGVVVSDVSINDFYVRAASGGNADPAIFVLIQNRGTVWAECSFRMELTFDDGRRATTNGNLNLQPGESVARGASVPERRFEKGVGVNVQIIMRGIVVAERATYLAPAESGE